MLANIIVFDVGSTYTKAAAFHMEKEELTFLGRGQSPTTLNRILDGADAALDQIRNQGVTIDPMARRYSSCSAAGGLRMVALGYMPRVTAKAAKEVAMTAGARVMEVISCEEPPSYRLEVLQEIRPDIILLAGRHGQRRRELSGRECRHYLPCRMPCNGDSGVQPLCSAPGSRTF